ncbi:MAG: hypothetical protein HY909_03545 [Deltaproteobacteria bacterium]|nr:hypothetical protein [Deltaproteobacteria bacterium]
MRPTLAWALGCALALSPGAALADPPDAPPPRWTVSVDPLTTALGFVHVQVERAFGRRVSVYVGPSLRLFDGIQSERHEPYLGLGVEVGVRGFFYGHAPEGAWVSIRGVAARVSTSTPAPDASFGGYVSALVGYTYLFRRWLVLSGGLGVQYLDYRVGAYGTRGVLPAAHTALGFAF